MMVKSSQVSLSNQTATVSTKTKHYKPHITAPSSSRNNTSVQMSARVEGSKPKMSSFNKTQETLAFSDISTCKNSGGDQGSISFGKHRSNGLPTNSAYVKNTLPKPFKSRILDLNGSVR